MLSTCVSRLQVAGNQLRLSLTPRDSDISIPAQRYASFGAGALGKL